MREPFIDRFTSQCFAELIGLVNFRLAQLLGSNYGNGKLRLLGRKEDNGIIEAKPW